MHTLAFLVCVVQHPICPLIPPAHTYFLAVHVLLDLPGVFAFFALHAV